MKHFSKVWAALFGPVKPPATLEPETLSKIEPAQPPREARPCKNPSQKKPAKRRRPKRHKENSSR
jgi:hypothetical protein